MSFFLDYLLSVFGINGKKNIVMEEYISKIERFLKGQMSNKEELDFKLQLASDKPFRSLALSMSIILKYFTKT